MILLLAYIVLQNALENPTKYSTQVNKKLVRVIHPFLPVNGFSQTICTQNADI